MIVVKSIHIPPVELTAKDFAMIFMDGDGEMQAEILTHMADIISFWTSPWAFQCGAIDDKLKEPGKARVIQMLKTLVEHLEPA